MDYDRTQTTSDVTTLSSTHQQHWSIRAARAAIVFVAVFCFVVTPGIYWKLQRDVCEDVNDVRNAVVSLGDGLISRSAAANQAVVGNPAAAPEQREQALANLDQLRETDELIRDLFASRRC